MASFTTPTTIQTKELYHQLQNAFYERYQVMCPSATPSWCLAANNIAADVNLQDNAFWKAWYDRVSTLLSDAATNGSYFLRTTSAPPDYEDDVEGTISVYNGSADLGALWAAAIGNSGGPRRYTSANSWTYGRHVTGDAIGPWLIEDLQATLRCLKYTIRLVDGGVTYQAPLTWNNGGTTEDRGKYLDGNPQCRVHWGKCTNLLAEQYRYEQAVKNHNWTTGHDTGAIFSAGNISTNALVSSTVSNRMGIMMRTFFASNHNGINQRVVNSVTEAGYVQLTGLPTSIAHSADLYLVMDEVYMPEIEWDTGQYLYPGEYWTDISPPWPSDIPALVTFKPINYAGRISGPGRYVKVSSYTSSAVPSRNYSFSPTLSMPGYGSAEYNLFGYNGEIYEANTFQDTPWHGCQMNKQTTWVLSWAWSYT